jgi:HAD superfamily hydrolase (TIGR01509 family)
VLAGVGITLEWADYVANCIGVSDLSMLGFFSRLSGGRVSPEEIRPLYVVKQEVFRQRAAVASVIPRATIELMQSLNGMKRAVVTSSAQVEIEPLLARAGVLPLLNTIVYGGDVKRLKPAPDPYLLAAERTAASLPLVLEDSDAGIAAAQAAGFDVIRVASPSDVPALVRARLEI